MLARRTDIEIVYEGRDISIDLRDFLTSFTYTDCASGTADSISISVADHGKKWLGDWFPEKTDRIEAAILVNNWHYNGEEWRLPCGRFTVDTVSFAGPPVLLNLVQQGASK